MVKRKRLVIVGGGHAHLELLSRLDEIIRLGNEVVLINPSPFHYYSGMGPGLLSGTYTPAQARFPVEKIISRKGGRFILDRVVRIDPARKRLLLAAGDSLDYDLASFNVGSEVPLQRENFDSQWCLPVKPIEGLAEARKRILSASDTKQNRFAVIGGGPAGVELAANLKFLLTKEKRQGEVLLLAKGPLLHGFPLRMQNLARRCLLKQGIHVMEETQVESVLHGTIKTLNGESIPCHFALAATGVLPSRIFADSDLPIAEDGGLLVNPQLQGIDNPDIFGGGDCISLFGQRLARVGVYAVRQAPILAHNILARLTGKELQSFVPQRDFLLILNLGQGGGLLRRNGFVWQGQLAFQLKNFIDQRFMQRYQGCGDSTKP